MLIQTTKKIGFVALLAALPLCVGACSDSGLSGTGAGPIPGKGKKDEASKTSGPVDDENATADSPTQVSGAFLVCGKDTGGRDAALPPVGEQDGCAVIDGATLMRKSCQTHDQVKVTYTDGTQADVAVSMAPSTSFWHFRFVAAAGATVQAVTARSTCDGVVDVLPSRSVIYVPATKGDGSADLGIEVQGVAAPNMKPDSSAEVPAGEGSVVDPGAAPLPPATAGEASYVIFVTSKVFKGNLGGRAGADQKCRDAAAEAGLPSAFHALLSTPDASVNRTFRNDRAIENMLGEVVVDAGRIWSGVASRPVKYDEHGQAVTGSVWTGSDAYGNYEQVPMGNGYYYSSCYGWTRNDAGTGGGLGDPNATDATWLDTFGGIGCDKEAHLYCISQ